MPAIKHSDKMHQRVHVILRITYIYEGTKDY